MRLHRLCRLFAAVAVAPALLGLCLRPAEALVVYDTLGNTTAPADDPGWANISENRSSVYLGDGWVLDADHSFDHLDQSLVVTFNGVQYRGIPGTYHSMQNPNAAALSMTANSDVQMYRIDGNPNLPSVTIASQRVGANQPVTMISSGGNPQPNPSDPSQPLIHDWFVNTNQPLAEWAWHSTSATCTGACTTFLGALVRPIDGRTKRWGTNIVINPKNETGLAGTVMDAYEAYTVNGVKANFEFTVDHAVLWRSGTPGDIVGLMTRFDNGGTTDEAQAAQGDSGGAVFYKRNGQWELTGLFHFTLGWPGQPGGYALYGNYSIFSDLSVYREQIMGIMADFPEYSIMGDINLDGAVTGNGLGSVATDDVSAFVAGWMHQQAVADVNSWKKGDLDLNGVTNLADFILLRNALGGTIGTSALQSLVGTSIPEPSTLLLAALGSGALLLSLSRRRRPM